MTSDRPAYQPYLDGKPAPFRWRLGLRPLDLADWLQVTEHYDHEVALKHRYSDEFPDTTLRFLDGVEAEAQEVLDAIVDRLRAHDPERFGHLTDDPGGRHPLDAAGRLVQEDLVLLVERDDGLVCGGGSVCFPNRWDLNSKVGQTMAEVHAPVAQLNEQLESPIDKFMDRLEPDRSFWRLGYSLIETDELYQATDGTAAPERSDVPPEHWWLRVERETLRRFPATRCILFTIHSYLTRLSDLAGTDDGAQLATAIEAMPDDVLDYKSIRPIIPQAVAYLRRQPATA
ncbi:MAG TPA: DUF3445 domain-containing protein [Ilumatobacter sp.]|nr:DUF3445 domain-containing protein [Ilumatobacter sp.]